MGDISDAARYSGSARHASARPKLLHTKRQRNVSRGGYRPALASPRRAASFSTTTFPRIFGRFLSALTLRYAEASETLERPIYG